MKTTMNELKAAYINLGMLFSVVFSQVIAVVFMLNSEEKINEVLLLALVLTAALMVYRIIISFGKISELKMKRMVEIMEEKK